MASRFDDPEEEKARWPAGATKEKPKVVALPQQPKPDFPVVWVGDAVLSLDTKPIIKGLIEPGGFSVIYGPSGSGKSFFTADMAQHIALGQSWRGRKVTQGLSVYVASEAGSSILKRFVGWRDHKIGEAAGKIPLAIFSRGPNLLNTVDFSKFEDQLKALTDEVQLPLNLVVFDTLSRSMPGGDENKAEDMTMAVQSADLIRDRFNSATAYVHHTGKDPDKGVRGHSALFAAADLVLRVMDKHALVEKVRDGVAGEKFGFELTPIKIGVDADGEDVFTCLLGAATEPVDAPKRQVVLKGRTLLGVRSLKAAIESDGQVMPGSSSIPKGVKAVRLEQWRAQFDRMYGSDGKTPASQAFYKCREALIDQHITISDPYVWLT